MNINLDHIFGHSKTEQTFHEESSDLEQRSEIQSLQSLSLRYNLNYNPFEDENDKNSRVILRTSSVRGEEIYQGKEKLPGERLFYESKNNVKRKQQEIQRIKKDKEVEQEKHMTFQPQINKNSIKVLQNKNKRKLKPSKKVKVAQKTTEQKRIAQQLKQCTFNPSLVCKPDKNIKVRQKYEVFNELYLSSRFKEHKVKLKQEEEAMKKKEGKKFVKKDFQQFLKRNDQFMLKTQKKKVIVNEAVKEYNLDTGKKMFVPQINASAFHKKQATVHVEQKKLEEFQPRSIFAKNSQFREQETGIVQSHFSKNQTEKLSSINQSASRKDEEDSRQSFDEGSEKMSEKNMSEKNQIQKIENGEKIEEENKSEENQSISLPSSRVIEVEDSKADQVEQKSVMSFDKS